MNRRVLVTGPRLHVDGGDVPPARMEAIDEGAANVSSPPVKSSTAPELANAAPSPPPDDRWLSMTVNGDLGREVRLGFWGTSLTSHPAAFSLRLIDQARLPSVGEAVKVEGVHCRGYVHRMAVGLRLMFPRNTFRIDNYGQGGATSRDVLAAVRRTTGPRYEIACCEVGTNDVLRRFQGRDIEAVSVEEFAGNYREILAALSARAPRVVCIGAPPIGWSADTELDVASANRELLRYNALAASCAEQVGAVYVDVWSEFVRTAGLLGGWSLQTPTGPLADNLWHSDGLHPSEELGVELISALVTQTLRLRRDSTRTAAEIGATEQQFGRASLWAVDDSGHAR